MSGRKMSLIVAGLFLLWAYTASAQSDEACSEFVQSAITQVTSNCSQLGSNQVCYGNVRLEAVPYETAPAFSFEAPGDVISIDAVQRLQLSSLDTASDEWGIALMLLQANLPDTLPGQNISIVLFGDVEIEDAVQARPVVEFTTRRETTLYDAPNGNALSTVPERYAGMAYERHQQGIFRFIHVILEDGSEGWLDANMAISSGRYRLEDLPDINAEPVEEEPDDLQPVPMQAFYFRSGIGDSACAGIPGSGILIQTPEGLGEVTFSINEVVITLGSTAFLQAQPGRTMSINIIEGGAQIFVPSAMRCWGSSTLINYFRLEFAVTRSCDRLGMPAGSRITFSLSTDYSPGATVTGPEPYDLELLQALPLDLLERSVEVAPPVTEQQINGALFALIGIEDVEELAGAVVCLAPQNNRSVEWARKRFEDIQRRYNHLRLRVMIRPTIEAAQAAANQDCTYAITLEDLAGTEFDLEEE